jgi:two-component system, sensor histidine kinase FlrB
LSTMQKLPITRQKQHLTRMEAPAGPSAQQDLACAFVTFTQAATSLEKSYVQLQAEVSRLHLELRSANAELDRSLLENAQVRGYLSDVLENLPCGIVVVNSNKAVQFINPEARRLLEFPEADHSTSKLQSGPLLEKLLDTGGTLKSSFSEHELAPAGNALHRTIGLQRKIISHSESSGEDTIWIVRDLTEQKRAAQEREASKRSAALAEVATVLAHEIRNPLGSMELFTGLLADATAHMPETRQWLTHLQAGLRTLSTTVNNVLQFHGQPPAQMIPTDLDRVLTETVDFLRPLARQRGQQVRFENQIGVISTHADPNRLKQMFFNLAINAFRAMPPGGVLTVIVRWAAQFPGGLAQIDFHDEGRGIAEELLNQIFEPGYTTTPGNPGLGLAVSRKVVEQHGGEIRVQSKVQQGTTFSVVLPISGGIECSKS